MRFHHWHSRVRRGMAALEVVLVTGLALPPDQHPSLFELAGVERLITSRLVDLRNPDGVRAELSGDAFDLVLGVVLVRVMVPEEARRRPPIERTVDLVVRLLAGPPRSGVSQVHLSGGQRRQKEEDTDSAHRQVANPRH